MSKFTQILDKLGFFCGIEGQLYIQDTGKYTMLIVEINLQASDGFYKYDFYKQTFYPRFPNKVTVYGEMLDASQLIKRVSLYMKNRNAYWMLKERE
ncbi:hypothetical protein ACWOFR_03640 [Carnobacterium gallinarum]|uniref:hypothetical protein n=1 Tax=Carnobacterium gallinarum TaxID=2749 RepID=UPI00054FBCA5|nr:hypothetical protein [Carnobacterium gallinarum]